MPETTLDAEYYHRVVDCQWACPAHTPVPEYIRLIAEGRFTDAYMVNRDSNVFPGILGRVCDRPCEPACRRGRVEEEPVAICRLKRVAADFKDDIRSRLPKAPPTKNGKRVALIGSGPASLTVANDLLPLGYDVTLFEKDAQLGGAMRASVPLFRLPATVLDEEIGYIVDMGLDVRLNTEVSSLRALLDDGYDAVFLGSGAPIGRDLDIPGRQEADKSVHIGLDWLANVAFKHVSQIPANVLVIGGGNTAMDCCRTARRIGGESVQVIAPESFEEMLASPWEKEETLEEGIQIRNHLLPKAFLVNGDSLVGMRFQQLKTCYKDGKWAPEPSGESDIDIACEAVILAIGQSNAFPYIDDNLSIERIDTGLLKVDEKTFQTSIPNVFAGGDSAFGPKNIIWAVAHGHEAALSIHAHCQSKDTSSRPEIGLSLVSQKMGLHEWSYSNPYAADERYRVPHAKLADRFSDLKKEVELGYDEKLALAEAERCLNCDVQTVFESASCIECDACVDICPLQCLTMTTDAPLEILKDDLSVPALRFPDQSLAVSQPMMQTGRVMVKDEDLCVHCGLCAERCPTGAWDMQKMTLDLPRANRI